MMAFVASTASSKRRPVIVRHKSSQPSSSTASAKNSPPTAHQLKRTSTQVEFPKVDFNPPRPVLSGGKFQFLSKVLSLHPGVAVFII